MLWSESVVSHASWFVFISYFFVLSWFVFILRVYLIHRFFALFVRFSCLFVFIDASKVHAVVACYITQFVITRAECIPRCRDGATWRCCSRGVVLHHSQRSVASHYPRSVVLSQRSVAACGVVPLFVFHDVVSFFVVFRDVVSLFVFRDVVLLCFFSVT